MATDLNVWAWSVTPADNATADASINWAEGQDPATVNNSARGMMAAIAKMTDVQSGNVDGRRHGRCHRHHHRADHLLRPSGARLPHLLQGGGHQYRGDDGRGRRPVGGRHQAAQRRRTGSRRYRLGRPSTTLPSTAPITGCWRPQVPPAPMARWPAAIPGPGPTSFRARPRSATMLADTVVIKGYTVSPLGALLMANPPL